jgi:LPS-assembly protein
LPLSCAGALPELSSIDPIEYDEEAQRLVARGDARLDYGTTRLTADRITYYEAYRLADATGKVRVNHEGKRLLADRMSFDLAEEVFAVDLFRTGQWPFYLSGVSAGGTAEQATMEGTTLYYGEPGPLTPAVSSETITYTEGEQVKMDGATFRIGRLPVLYLPGYTHRLGEPPVYLELGAGYGDDLGAYVQSLVLAPLGPLLRVGANLDYYTERGFLAGPAAQYRYDSATQSMRGALTTGYIKDRDLFGEDVLDRPLEDEERGFAEWRHQHRIGERFSAIASLTYWSDSEVTRDFREDLFNRDREPDTYAEAVYAGDNYLLSAFGRFRPNDFQLVQERLPELRFDLLPVPVFKTGAYHRLSAAFTSLEEDFSEVTETSPVTLLEESSSKRIDAVYRIERPVALAKWLTLTPLAGARWTQYLDQERDPFFGALEDEDFDRTLFEAGFDLEASAHATYPTVNRTWGIDGLRHIVRPVLRYRYVSDPDDEDAIARIDRDTLQLQRPLLDLADIRAVDTIAETHLARVGLENLFQTRAEGYGSRTLAALNFYQDIVFEKNQRYDGEEQNTFDATWFEIALSPAPWLKFDLAARLHTEDVNLEELRTRLELVSGEIWALGLSTASLDKTLDQYRLDFRLRLNERFELLTDARFDGDTGELTRAGIGLRSRIGTAWEILYALTFREDARREGDLEFSVRLRLARP